MWQAYVGIVSQRGLEVFCPEQPETALFLRRRAQRLRRGAACFWTVIADDSAAEIYEALRRGCSRAACELLQVTAREFGFLLPSDDEPAEGTKSNHHG